MWIASNTEKKFLFSFSKTQQMECQNFESVFIQCWHDINNAFGNPSIDDNIKYKQCGGCIVQMKRTLETKDNEMRIGVKDKRYAKFRANKLMVLKIYNWIENCFEYSIPHAWCDIDIRYTVGEIVVSNGFCENINDICAQGIHYFNSLFAAHCYYPNDLLETCEDGRFFCVNPENNNMWFATHFNQFNVICY